MKWKMIQTDDGKPWAEADEAAAATKTMTQMATEEMTEQGDASIFFWFKCKSLVLSFIVSKKAETTDEGINN